VADVTCNLTEYELRAVDAPLNVADGHARQPLTASQQEIVDRFPDLFEEATTRSLEEVEYIAHDTFFRALGQRSAPYARGQVLTSYASSVSMDVVARCLAERGAVVGLIHPTFDNIPDLLRARGVQLVPVSESALRSGELPGSLGIGDAVFVTVPNNPTGGILDADDLRRLAEACRSRQMLLALDTSFRGFDCRVQYDFYELLDACGCDYVVIEDTGKLWPFLELKLGFIACSDSLKRPLAKAHSDVLLSASPFVMRVVTELARDAVAGGFDEMRQLIARNRAIIDASMADVGCRQPFPDSRVSVTLVGVPGRNASVVSASLAERGVHVLRCEPFFWDQRRIGEQYVRVALARESSAIEQVADELREVCAESLHLRDAEVVR
jgi:enduracididine biosynthesis enzyme MppP